MSARKCVGNIAHAIARYRDYKGREFNELGADWGETLGDLSNGNVALLVDMAKRAGLPWDAVLSAELFGRYKPDPEVYRGAARLLGCEVGEVAMVAAHPSDLAAAQRAGLMTAYIVVGPHVPADLDADGDGLFEAWENAFGLDPLVGTADDGASGDIFARHTYRALDT